MGATSNKLSYLIATKAAIMNAIRAKGVDVSNEDTFRSYADKIGEISQDGGGEVVVVDSGLVRFFDYDGTVLHAYSKDEALSMEELPALPAKVGLTCQGWTHTVDEIKQLVGIHGRCDIGATYITDDGKTRLYISIDAEGRMDVPLYFYQSIGNGVTIDWGDWSAKETIAASGYQIATHKYGAAGDYIISLEVSEGCTLHFGRNSNDYAVLGKTSGPNAYKYMLTRVELGEKVSSLGYGAFNGCFSLKYMTIPQGVTGISSYAFVNCKNIRTLIIPKGASSIGIYSFNFSNIEHIVLPPTLRSIGETAFTSCLCLKDIVIPETTTTISRYAFSDCSALTSVCLPTGLTSIAEGVFSDCTSLKDINIPSGVTSIGSYAFSYCSNLESVVIPNGVAVISQYAFQYCRNLLYLEIPEGVTNIQQYAFYYCSSLPSVKLPSTLTTLGAYVFQACSSLTSIEIPEGVASYSSYMLATTSLRHFKIGEHITSIPSAMLLGCYGLTSLEFPEGIASIAGSAFGSCYGIGIYDFTKHTAVPTLANVNAFNNMAADCEIIVPYQLYYDWIAAANWSSLANNIKMDYTPTECQSLEVDVDDVPYGNFKTVKLNWTAVTNGFLRDGTRLEGITLTGGEEIYIGYNTSTESVTKEVSFTYLGVTASATITQGGYIANCLTCKYNATSTTSATTLMYSSFSNYSTYFSSMIVDGEEKTLARSYTFSSLGEHLVIFKVADGVSITTPYRMFYNCTALTYVDCTEFDLSKATSSSSSAGTSYMFYGCTNLKTIIFKNVALLGYYTFGNCGNVTTLVINKATAPSLYGSYTFGSGTYLGYNNRNKGINRFYVPVGATGYDSSYWKSYLQNTSYCGFTKVESADL